MHTLCSCVLTREVIFIDVLVNSYRCDEFVVNDTLSGVIDSIRQHILHSSTLYVSCIPFLSIQECLLKLTIECEDSFWQSVQASYSTVWVDICVAFMSVENLSCDFVRKSLRQVCLLQGGQRYQRLDKPVLQMAFVGIPRSCLNFCAK